MRKLLNKPWVVALLAVAALALVGQSLRDEPARRPERVAPVEVAPEDTDELSVDVAGSGGSLAEVLASLSLPGRLPDPFAPRRLRAASEAAPESTQQVPDQSESVHLSAIWVQDGAVFLLLNGRIVRPGDTLGRITVGSIEDDGVWLTHWKGRDFVRLGQDFTLVTPAAPAANPETVTHEG